MLYSGENEPPNAVFMSILRREAPEIKRILEWEDTAELSESRTLPDALWSYLQQRELDSFGRVEKQEFLSGKTYSKFYRKKDGIFVEFHPRWDDGDFGGLFLTLALTSMQYELRYGHLCKNVYPLGDLSYSSHYNGEFLWRRGDWVVHITSSTKIDKNDFVERLRLAGEIDLLLQNQETSVQEDQVNGLSFKPFRLDKADNDYFDAAFTEE